MNLIRINFHRKNSVDVFYLNDSGESNRTDFLFEFDITPNQADAHRYPDRNDAVARFELLNTVTIRLSFKKLPSGNTPDGEKRPGGSDLNNVTIEIVDETRQ